MAGELMRSGVRLLAAIALAFALMLAAAAASAQPQPRFGLSPEAYAVFNRWMLASCIGGDERALADALRRYPQPLTKAFQQAIREGPSPKSCARCVRGPKCVSRAGRNFP